MNEAPYASDPAEVARALDSDLERGLAQKEAARRLATYGRNAPEGRRRPPYLRIALRQLYDPLVALLLVAAAISIAIGERAEGVAIAAILVLNGVLGFWQEAGAERAILALSQAFTQTALVVRDGERREIPADEVVPGRPAPRRRGRSGRRRRAGSSKQRALEVDESALTGESLPVAKQIEPVDVGDAAGRAGVDDLRGNGGDPRRADGARLRDRADARRSARSRCSPRRRRRRRHRSPGASAGSPGRWSCSASRSPSCSAV